MAIPYSSLTNLPLGFTVSTVPGMGECIVQGVSGNSFSNRVISRTDGNGDRSDFEIRKSSEPFEVTLTVQRATTSTGIPNEGGEIAYDFDRSGTASDLIIKDATVNRDVDSFDTVDIVCVFKDSAS